MGEGVALLGGAGLGGVGGELRGLIAVHPIAHGDDGIEVVVARLVVFPVGGSCVQNGNN